MTYEKIRHRLPLRRYRTVLGTIVFISLASCLSVPPEVVRLHQKEQEIINNLRVSHLALADGYMDKKLEEFERFFFDEYGPMFRKQWLENFEAETGRPYDPEKDWNLFYNDLVAVYQIESAPIAGMRTQLRNSITAEYRNALDAHQTLGEWMDTLEKLSDIQRQVIDQVLGLLIPGLSKDKIDSLFDGIQKKMLSQVES